ncbi:MAG: DNA-directed RNA polymerase subunit alpha [Candidatus Pacebacteria bacterium]|nr:DNA-directed RNA polymerase subunit alpha [Candidatus Paceibacterota bacterium]
MSLQNIILPSRPKAILEETDKGIFEIDGLAPGYGYTLGNSMRRIILSSLPGAAIVSVKIDGVSHEFSAIEGVKEDVITILLSLKKVRFKLTTDEPQTVTLSVTGPKVVTAADIKTTGQVEVMNPELKICEITAKKTLNIEINIEKGIGFVPKEQHTKTKVDIGTISTDAIFSPVRRVSYEVENMRVGDKTNHNRLRINIETDGTISPREALERSIRIMIDQLKAVANIQDEEIEVAPVVKEEVQSSDEEGDEKDISDVLKTRIDTLDLSTRVLNALNNANIRTLGGLSRKKEIDLMELPGLGQKGVDEIKDLMEKYGLQTKD